MFSRFSAAGFGRLRRSKRQLLTGAAASAITAALVVGALLYPGFKTADVDLNDGGVWVTNESADMVGHLNYESQVLDGGFTAGSAGFDVLQAGRSVLMEDTSAARLSPVDPASVSLGTGQELPSAAEVDFGDDVIAIADPAAGSVWVTTADGLSSFDEKSSKPVVADSAGVLAAVGADDTVYVADVEAGQITTVEVNDDGEVVERESTRVDGLSSVTDGQLAVIGDKPVVLDPNTGLLYLPSSDTVQIPDPDRAMLQQSGPAADTVAVATADALITVPLDGSDPSVTRMEAPGDPAAPVQQDGCIHAAWAGSGIYLRDCADANNDTRTRIEGLGGQADLVFRVNRDVVVLNDVADGNIWLVNNNMILVQNWDQLIPPSKESDDPKEDAADENLVNTLPDRTKKNRPPVAKDDSFGVRAGHTTVLPVLDNDSDPDGDILTVRVRGDGPRLGTVQPIYGKTGLQIVVPRRAQGSSTFTYEVSDGRGKTDTATVSMRVSADGTNEAPKPKRATEILVQSGETVSQNILTDWVDPDGDDLFLKSASIDTGDDVQHRPDGLLTFRDAGVKYGTKEVTVTVSDGRTTTEGTVTLDVKPPGELAPTVNPDHVAVVAGQQTVISPLKNDIDPNGEQLRLARVEQESGADAEVTPNYDAGTITFSSDDPGSSHYLKYLAASGPKSSPGLLRVDVISPDADGDPVAVRDVGLLPAGGEVLVDPLANDADPAGGVLVLQSVSTPGGAPVSVSVLDHHILRIKDVRGLSDKLTLTYTISNGNGRSTGEVTVMSVPKPAKLQPPDARDDEVTVRAGDVVTVDVLDNDRHPSGGELELGDQLVEKPAASAGRMFIAGDTIRFIAGENPGTVHAVYNAVDTRGQKDSAAVQINIRPVDAQHNSRPQPQDITGRVLAGESVRIPVTLDGIDPDGDSVRLIGVDMPPKLGTAVVGSNYIDYTASAAAAGTDTFTYTVEDRLGARSTGTAQVGIAPEPTANQSPVTVDDSTTVRPGRRVAVDVLSNDSDPDGDRIGLVQRSIDAPAGVTTEVVKGRILVTAPHEPGTTSLRYTIKDGRGATDVGTVRVKTDPQAALLAPTARDDRVTEAETMGKTAVDVPVLDNDEDPDGVAEELTISFPGTHDTASVRDGKARVTLTKRAQIIPYTVTDMDGQTATAIIWVPGIGAQHPVLRSHQPIEVTAGDTLTLDLDTLVKVRQGRSPRLTVDEKIHAIGASNAELATDADKLTYVADRDYQGPGSITFEVTDGAGPDDPDGLKSTLTVPITVKADPDRNYPPKFSAFDLSVAQAEPAKTIDLSERVRDKNPEDRDSLVFAIAGDVPDGLDVSLHGHTLSVAATSEAEVGSSATLLLSVTDGRSDPVTSQASVQVTSSTRPLTVVNNDTVPNAHQGETETVDVLANDAGPFGGSALEVISAVVETGSGNASTNGDTVHVTPAGSFVGTMVVRYTVADKTGDPSRYVDGRVTLNVKGKPDAPGTPRVEDVRDGTVVLNWSPPSSNGAAITGYRVTGSHGVSQQCGGTTCTITGLTNDTVYTFTVTATNAVGTSEPSPRSAEARPDVKPEQPAPPRLKFGDGSVSVTWAEPVSHGSPVQGYDLSISPAPPGGAMRKSGVTGTSLTWNGLENGVAYKVRVRATNKADEPSAWSVYSAAEVPAGKPAAPSSPSTRRVKPVGTQSQIKVGWNQPSGNGDPVDAYRLKVYQGSSLVRTLDGISATSQTIALPNAETEYTFRVQGTNKAGYGPLSAASAPRHAFGVPGRVSGVSASLADTDGAGGAITVRYSPLSASGRNGARPNQIRYDAHFSNGQVVRGIDRGQTVTGFSNGSGYTVRVTAVSTADGASYPGAASAASQRVVPFGRPYAPTATASDGGEGDKTMSFGWDPPAENGRTITRLQISVDGGGWQNVGTGSGSKTVGDGYSQSHSLRVRACDSSGQCGDADKASGSTGTEPPPPAEPDPKEWHGTVTVNSCLEHATGPGGHWSGGNCSSYMLPKGTDITVTCERTSWGSHSWFRMTRGYGDEDYRWIKPDTTTISTGDVTKLCN